MIKEKIWFFEDDKLFKSTPVPELGANISRRQLMLTKEIFQECFIRWIMEDKEDEYGRCNERV